MTRKEILELTGEDPIDMFGPDWQNVIVPYLEESDKKLCLECDRVFTQDEFEQHQIKNFQNSL